MTHYRLTFVTAGGARKSLRVNHVDPAISKENLQAAVDKLLAFDIMAPGGGALNRLHSLVANTVTSSNLLA